MRQLPQEKQPGDRGIITTLSTGFDQTTRHIWIILLPFLLDVFYWIGPRLSIEKLIESSARTLQAEAALADVADQMLLISSQFNLFTSISLPIIGIPALMAGPVPEKTPIAPAVIQLEDPFLWMGLFLGLSFMGLILTSLYLGLISHILNGKNVFTGSLVGHYLRRVSISFIRLIGLVIIFIIALFIVWIPLVPLGFLASFLSGNMFFMVMMVGLILVVTYLCLAIPAIFMANRTLIAAVKESIKMVHQNIIPLMGLLIIVVVVNSGTSLLWHMADNGNWMTLISLAGNAFISTALIMAIFIFYRDRKTKLHLTDSA